VVVWTFDNKNNYLISFPKTYFWAQKTPTALYIVPQKILRF